MNKLLFIVFGIVSLCASFMFTSEADLAAITGVGLWFTMMAIITFVIGILGFLVSMVLILTDL